MALLLRARSIVAHNVATTHSTVSDGKSLRRLTKQLPFPLRTISRSAEDAGTLRSLYELIDKLKPPDRQIVLLYLEI
jgi:hypothetical protein